jgi:shikimate kinase
MMILCGFKSCGKSYFGKRLAERHKIAFIDTDRLLEEQFSLPCAQIARKFGEKTFRYFEREVIAKLEGSADAVIALGGGSLLCAENAKLLSQLGTLVYLQLSKERLKERLLSQTLPTFLDPADPAGSFEKMFAEREPLYKQLSHAIISLDGKSDEEVLRELEEIWAATLLG